MRTQAPAAQPANADVEMADAAAAAPAPATAEASAPPSEFTGQPTGVLRFKSDPAIDACRKLSGELEVCQEAERPHAPLLSSVQFLGWLLGGCSAPGLCLYTLLAQPLHAVRSGACAGVYDLVAVLTHKGRSADSGHYVSWAKQDDGAWVQFDDEEMIPRKADEIVTLSGGGDWHMAYLLLYRAQKA